jgi:hypothetical protein
MSDIATAVEKINERLRNIGAALRDLRPSQFAGTTDERMSDSVTIDIHRNRVFTLLINLYHLKDDARGLARACGLDKEVVEAFCRDTPAVDLCIKAGDTYKHGRGGRAKNNTVIDYEVTFVEQKEGEPQPTDPVVGAVMLVVDKDGEPHQSDLLAGEALREWADFLEKTLGVTSPAWVSSWLPGAPKPGESIYTAPLPAGFREHLKQEAAARS